MNKIYSKYKHDTGYTKVVSGPSPNQKSWTDAFHTGQPFCCVMTLIQRFGKDYSCEHIKYPHYAFEYVLEGELEITRENQTFSLGKGEAMILISGENSTLKIGKCGFCLKASATFTGELSHSVFSAFQLTEPEKFRPHDVKSILNLLNRLGELLERKDPETEPEISGLSFEFIHLISRDAVHGDDYLLERAKRLLILNVPGKEKISDIALRLNTNVNTLERIFRKKLNLSPLQYLKNMRLNTACELLKSGNLRIARIAERVGYDNPLVFSSAFRQFRGCSPRVYREKFSELSK